MYKKVFSHLREYKKYAFLTPIIMIGEVIMEILIPYVMAEMINRGIKGDGGTSFTVKAGLLMIGMAVISLCFGALGGMTAARAGMGFGKNLRGALFNKVQDYSFANVDKFSTASLVTRLTTDVTNIQNTLMMLIRMAIRAPFMMVGAMIMAVKISPKLSTVFFVAVPVLAIILVFIMTNAHPRFSKMLKKYDAMNASVQENLIGIRVVKAFVRERHEKEKFQMSAEDVRNSQIMAEKLIILNGPAMQISMYACIVAILWFGGNMVINATGMEIGDLSGFISYITQILSSLMALSFIFISLVISRASIGRVVEILDEDIDIKDAQGSTLTLEDGSIEFRHVNFSYSKNPDNLTLTDIDLKIRSGETVGVIGGTGSAKSTFVQLIPRLYDVLDGELIVGGHNVKDYRLSTLRDDVAMVLQKNVLFSGTIKDNLKWGNENATDEEIIQACKNAQAHDFITSFPDGYDTVLGQGGVNVSGGQKQRLCIARALLKRPKIIILVDSTSAVDTATDAKIRQAFRNELGDTTAIIIAQRISSVQDADRTVVLDDGKVVAFDTHENLLKTCDIYREVYESQMKGDED